MDETLLHSSPTEENPLTLAFVSGDTEFAEEIFRQRPELAQELDEDGFSPLHVAAAAGQPETVRAILGIDRKLCRVKGRDGKTPFHVAATKGKVDVIREMVLSCVECLEDVTLQGETALHLAVKHNRVEAVVVMVLLIRDMKRDDLLSKKDKQGNTLLHLATWRKQCSVIEILLQAKPADSRSFEVNAVNKTGVTALDLLLMFPSEAGDRKIYEVLNKAGAREGKELITLTTTTPTNQEPMTHEPNPDDPLSFFTLKRHRDSTSEARGALLVVASLVAMAMFQTALNPPGGTWKDSYTPTGQSNGTTTDPIARIAGQSIMGTIKGTSFTLFVLYNTIGLSISLSLIIILTWGSPLRLEIQVCIFVMYCSYNTAMNYISPYNVQLYCVLITSIVTGLTPILMKFLRRPLYKLMDFLCPKLQRIFRFP